MKVKRLVQVDCDEFVAGLRVKLRNCLVDVGLNTEQRIRDSFARDGGRSISEIDGLGSGLLGELQDALLEAFDAREAVQIK